MPRISVETRNRVIHLKSEGVKLVDIQKRLCEEGVSIALSSLYRLIKKYNAYGSVENRHGLFRSKILSNEQVAYIHECMKHNDEYTGRHLLELLLQRWPNLSISVETIKRERRALGWVASKPKYCQLIRDRNKQKRLDWCNLMLSTNETFDNVIFSDECSVKLDNHGRLCFRLRGEPRTLKPKPKHPVKVHVWAGISKQGATQICIFTGVLDAVSYCNILEQTLIPFTNRVFPNSNYRFQQDNDPKHTSTYAQNFYIQKGIN